MVYDTGGRETSTSFDGKLLAAVERDLNRHSVVITDYTAGDGLGVEHVPGFDRRGLLTSRTRGTQRMCWDYDGDGNRTRLTDTHGTTTTYVEIGPLWMRQDSGAAHRKIRAIRAYLVTTTLVRL